MAPKFSMFDEIKDHLNTKAMNVKNYIVTDAKKWSNIL